MFAVSVSLKDFNPSGTSVSKVDAGGTVVSTFRFETGEFDSPMARGLVIEVASSGTSILYSGTFGNSDPKGATTIRAIAFDAAGNGYIGGSKSQSDFPVAAGGFKRKFGSPQQPVGWRFAGPTEYGFVARFAVNRSAGYTIGYSALLCGAELHLQPCPPTTQCYSNAPSTTVSALAVDDAGVVTAAGITNGEGFPVTAGAFQPECRCDLFQVAFMTRLSTGGSELVWSTMLRPESLVSAFSMIMGGIAIDLAGNVVVSGTTPRPDFPVTPGVVQTAFAGAAPSDTNGFVSKLDSTGSRLVFSTYYGGTAAGRISKPRLALGNIWLSEQSGARSGAPLREGSLMLGSVLVAELASDASTVLFSELLPNGAAGQDLVLDGDRGVIVAGGSDPLVHAQANGHLLRHPLRGPSGVSVLGIADVALNLVNSKVAPGEMIAIYDTGLGPQSGIAADSASGRIAASLAARPCRSTTFPRRSSTLRQIR